MSLIRRSGVSRVLLAVDARSWCRGHEWPRFAVDYYSIVRTSPASLPPSRKRILIWGLPIENLPAHGRSAFACG